LRPPTGPVRGGEGGDFREDLYFRLNVLPLVVPPLRERKADVARLAHYFLARFSEAEGRTPMALADDARELLEDYYWPGNVREMRNLMERAVVLVSGETITAADLNPWLEPAQEGAGRWPEGQVARARLIPSGALEAADWVSAGGRGLGIDRTNLHRKMRKYGIVRR
jgi:transcriptional regulator with GAF, ATPase, and Fis domain